MSTRLDSVLWRHRDTMERHDANDGSEVRFEFPLGFMIKVTIKGTTFVGTSVNYDNGSIMLIEETLKWCKIINEAMRTKLGIPPQAECEGHLKLKTKGREAWWIGKYNDRIKEEAVDGQIVPAAILLRRLARKSEIANAV